jgi:hypothetical protein
LPRRRRGSGAQRVADRATLWAGTVCQVETTALPNGVIRHGDGTLIVEPKHEDRIQIAQQGEPFSLFAVVVQQATLRGPVRVREGGNQRDLDAGQTCRSVRPPFQMAAKARGLASSSAHKGQTADSDEPVLPEGPQSGKPGASSVSRAIMVRNCCL